MENNKNLFMSIDEVAEFLTIDEKDVKTMIKDKSIPFSLLPSGQYIFHRPTIIDWTLSLNPTCLGASQILSSSSKEADGPASLVERIQNRFRYSYKLTKSGYINFYKGQKVFAQLHFPSTFSGIDLALCECENDVDLPETNILTRFHELWKLHGYQRNNKPWLDGTRISNAPAAAFNIPMEIGNDDNHVGWSEIDQLLQYCFNKR